MIWSVLHRTILILTSELFSLWLNRCPSSLGICTPVMRSGCFRRSFHTCSKTFLGVKHVTDISRS